MQSLSLNATAAFAMLTAAIGGGAAMMSHGVPDAAPVPVAKVVSAAAAVAALKPAAPPAITLAAAKPSPEDRLRAQLKYETVRYGGESLRTLDEASRLMLVEAAARQAGLHKVGLSHHDVYGIIEAETSWIARTGASKNGTPNLGLAQFEPATAKALGITNPDDPVQAVFGAATMMKDAAQWATRKLDGVKLAPDAYAAKLREGVSIYYNLSVKGRNKWDGTNTATLPIETQRHISNARIGAAEAVQLAKLLKA